MFCPSCGAANSTDQRFCRKCGMNLERAAESLREQYPSGIMSDLDRRERRVEKFGQLAFTGLLCMTFVAVIGLLYAILNRFVFSGDNPAVGILLMGIIVSGLLMLTYVYFREDLKSRRKEAASTPAPAELPAPAITGRLIEEREFEPVPTVTEDTTTLLPTPRRER